MKNKINLKLSIIFGCIFFLISLVTLKDYGINWDSVNHLLRGQTYLRYILTGQKNYDGLEKSYFTSDGQSKNRKYWQDPETILLKVNPNESFAKVRSIYQNDNYNYDYVISTDGFGHPPASDILSSFFNFVLFQKLHLINDIDSYRIYGVLLASVLVGLIYFWVAERYSKFAGFISMLTLSTYPLFWAESHFNIEKDIPETAFWGIFMFLLYKGVVEKKPKYILLASLIFGLAVGTKFNALFIAPIVIIWFIVYAFKNSWYSSKLFLALLIFPFISFGVYVFFWPYLWGDIPGHLFSVVKFYKEIGTSSSFLPRFTGLFGINTYPIQWIFYTTYPFVLFLSVLGLYKIVKNFTRDKTYFGLLILMWLMVPIIRVTMPGSNIYGGVRQIMEFIPALSILSGVGAYHLTNIFKHKRFKIIVMILTTICFSPLIVKLNKIHPYENAYFNSFMGGLSGAKERDFPYWGNTFGGAYRMGNIWINENAEENARVVFAYELMPNIPGIFFRRDLDVYNVNRSGYLKESEYAITVTFQGTDMRSYYDMYLERMLDPVFVGYVDGVSVVKVWKNDIEHLKKEYKKEKIIDNPKIIKSKTGLLIDLGTEVAISRLEAKVPQFKCERITSARFEVSNDLSNWISLPNILPDDWMIAILGEQPKDGKFIHPFAGDKGRYIRINIEPQKACLNELYNTKIYYFSETYK